MISYLLRRFVSAIIVIIGIMLVTFTMLHVIAPSPARAVLGIKASPAAIAGFNHEHGYDQPLWRQFLTYMNQTLHGNLGYSYKLNQSVPPCSRRTPAAARCCPGSRSRSRS